MRRRTKHCSRSLSPGQDVQWRYEHLQVLGQRGPWQRHEERSKASHACKMGRASSICSQRPEKPNTWIACFPPFCRKFCRRFPSVCKLFGVLICGGFDEPDTAKSTPNKVDGKMAWFFGGAWLVALKPLIQKAQNRCSWKALQNYFQSVKLFSDVKLTIATDNLA